MASFGLITVPNGGTNGVSTLVEPPIAVLRAFNQADCTAQEEHQQLDLGVAVIYSRNLNLA